MNIKARGLRIDLKRSSEDEMMKLGKQVQHLRHYLSASLAPTDDELEPADMAEYGFSTGAQLLDLCSAVGCLLTGLETLA